MLAAKTHPASTSIPIRTKEVLASKAAEARAQWDALDATETAITPGIAEKCRIDATDAIKPVIWLKTAKMKSRLARAITAARLDIYKETAPKP